MIRRSIEEEVACSNVRDILNKYRGPESKHVPTSWLDEIEEAEKDIKTNKNEISINKNEITGEDFSDIEMIRKKYLGMFDESKKSMNLESTSKFEASGGSKKDSSGKFEGSAPRKNNKEVDASIDNLLNTLKSSKKFSPSKAERAYHMSFS